jgi:hypothetical protein
LNRIQSRAVTGLLTGHNTLRRHLYIKGLINSPLCRRCGTEKETSAHILTEYEAKVIFRHTYMGSFFLDHDDVGSLKLRINLKGTGLP